MLSLKDFQRLSLEDKPVFDKHFSNYPPSHSDYLFTTMMSWLDYGNYQYALIDGNLIILTEIDGVIRFRPPVGKQQKQVFENVMQLAEKQSPESTISLIDFQTKNKMIDYFPQLTFGEHRDYFEYVYLTSELADLPGAKFSKIRNRLNKFVKNTPYTTEPITEENMNEVKEFLKRWCLWKDCESDELLENERKAILFSITHFFYLNLSGIAIRVNDDIEAISVFEPMTSDTAVVHYEKGSPDYDGIYKAINMETAKRLQPIYQFINRESDMGREGLRKAKTSYRPHHMIEIFHTTK